MLFKHIIVFENCFQILIVIYTSSNKPMSVSQHARIKTQNTYAHACRSLRDAAIVIRLACANVRSMSPRCSLLVTNIRKFGPNSAILIHAWSSAARFFCGMFSASSRASITMKTRSRRFEIASMHFKMSSITGGDRRLAGVKILRIAWGCSTWEANCFTRLPKMLRDVWFV